MAGEHDKMVGYFYRMMESAGEPYFHVTATALEGSLGRALRMDWDGLMKTIAELPANGYSQFAVLGGPIPCPNCLVEVTVLTVMDVDGLNGMTR